MTLFSHPRAPLIIRLPSGPEPILRRWYLPLLVLALLPAALAAQDTLPTDAADTPAPLLIHRITINRSDIFDSVETRHWYARVGNALHFMTRESIVDRELLFHEGDAYDSAKVAETARNLRQLNLFRQVKIDTVTSDSGVDVTVITKDGWTTKIDTRFRSTGGQTEYGATVSEGNTLGTGTKVMVRYRKTPDRSSVLFQFRQPRFIARSLLLNLNYDVRSDGRRASLQLERPFYSLETRKGISFLADTRDERVLRFTNGIGTASDSLRRRGALVRVEAATALRAATSGYVRLGAFGQVRRDDFVPEELKATQNPNTITGALGVFLEVRQANYIVTRGFVGIGRDEDVDVSRTFRVGLAVAPKAFGYSRDGLGGTLISRYGVRFPFGFGFVDGRANGLFTSAGLDSGTVQLGGTLVVQATRSQVSLLHADMGWIKQPLPGSEYDLGFALGPRSFPIHAFTGDREYFLTAEHRITLASDLFHLFSLGLAGFVDHGGAWFDGATRRTGSDVGFGFRLGQSRAADLDPLRIDFAYRFRNDQMRPGWVLVIAKGLVFSTTMRP